MADFQFFKYLHQKFFYALKVLGKTYVAKNLTENCWFNGENFQRSKGKIERPNLYIFQNTSFQRKWLILPIARKLGLQELPNRADLSYGITY